MGKDHAATILTGLLAACSGSAALAQEDTSPSSEPIIVTGERWQRTLAETASSVSVTSAEDLARQPDTDRLDQLLDATPNITVGSGGLGPAIRGLDTTGVLNNLPAFLGGNRPRTTVTVDGRAITYGEFVFGTQPLWDVERVEVFRSPQTTTQGRNSIAGAIFLETRSPEFDWGGAARLIGGNYDTRQASAMATGPLISEQLALRVVADHRRSRPSSELTTPDVEIDPNRDKYDQLRLKLLALPDALPGLRIETSYWIARSQAPQTEGVRIPFRERRDPRARYGIFRAESESGTLRASWDISAETTLHSTLTAGGSTLQRFAPSGFGETLTKARDRSGELILNHAAEGWKAVAGVSASRSRMRQTIDLSSTPFGVGDFRDRQDSFGLFGEGEALIGERLSLIVGARYQSDRQVRSGTLGRVGSLQVLDFDRTFEFFLPKFSLSFASSPDLTLGILVQKAANPGGITLTPPSGLDAFEEESLWDFELFARGRLADGRLRYAANLFRYEMKDAQRSVTFGVLTPAGPVFLSEIGNAPRAWSHGAELELQWQASNRLSVNAGLGLLDTRLTRTPSSEDPLLDKQFQRSPHFTASLGVDWRPAPSLAIDLGYRHRTGYYSDDVNSPELRVGASSVFDVRVSWERGSTRIFGFVRNMFDNFYLVARFSGPDPLATAGDPREYGIGIEARI